MNTSHLDALELRLSNEKCRFADDSSHVRLVWIAQIEKEIEDEKAFLGLTDVACDLSDDDLLAELL